MIEEHVDPVAEAHALTSNLLRTLFTAAATVADRRAQRRQAYHEHQRYLNETARQAVEKRTDAEREAAYLVYRPVYDPSWWETASPRRIRDAVVAAGTWAAADPRARDAWSELSEQLGARYGVDINEMVREAGGTAAPIEKVALEVRDQAERANKARAAGRPVPEAGKAAPDRGQAVPDASQPVQEAGQPAPETGQPAPDAGQAAKAVPWQERWEAEVVEGAGAALGGEIIAEKGWPELQTRLDVLKAAGENPSARLSAALADGGLDTAQDKASVLRLRMGNGQNGHPRVSGTYTKPNDAEHVAGRQRAERQLDQSSPGRTES